MATSGFPALDPLNLWRDALSKWEGGANQLANKQMGSEDFARAMNGLLSLSMGLQQALGQANGALLKELNLPSRNDMIEMGARLQRIEDAIEQLNQRLGGVVPAPAATETKSMPPRTRKPPSAVAAVAPTPAPVAAAPAAKPTRGKQTAQPAKPAQPARKSAKKKA